MFAQSAHPTVTRLGAAHGYALEFVGSTHWVRTSNNALLKPSHAASPVLKLPEATVCVAIDDGPRMLALCGTDVGELFLLDLEGGNPATQIALPGIEGLKSVTAVALSSAGGSHSIAVAGICRNAEEHDDKCPFFLVGELAGSKLDAKSVLYDLVSDEISFAAFAHGESSEPGQSALVAVACMDGSVTILDAAALATAEDEYDAVAAVLNTQHPVQRVRFLSKDRSRVLVQSHDNVLQLWDHDLGTKVAEFAHEEDYIIDSMEDADAREVVLFTGTYAGSLTWRRYENAFAADLLGTGTLKKLHAEPIRALHFDRAASTLTTASEDGTVCAIDCDPLPHAKTKKQKKEAKAAAGGKIKTKKSKSA